MRKYLLPARGRFYKANLHCHTTFSDGNLTPEEVKKLYASLGYSIVAFTDHDILVPHDELSDGAFLALHGFETETTEKKTSFAEAKTCHICYIALRRDQLTQPSRDPSARLYGHAAEHLKEVRFDASKPDFKREYTPENINRMIREAREEGFFVTYNHPSWSLENYDDYIAYEGMNAMEILNYGCLTEGYDDENPQVYDGMLRSGRRIYCLGGDDNHNEYPADHPKSDSDGAFTMIRASSLDYETVTNALAKGHFYASNGPRILSLYYEDGQVHIRCSPARRIIYSTAIRHRETAVAEVGKTIREASFRIRENDGYFRLTVVDRFGKRAYTNACFLDSL